MDQVARFTSGDHVVFRQLWADKVWAVLPMTVVEDSDELVSVYIAPGTKFLRTNCSREEYLSVQASGQWDLVTDRWWPQHHVWTSGPGEACSIWTMWSDPDWRHLGWKVNPEAPLKRTEIGFDTSDHVLDAVIPPDLGSWSLKDEDELTQAIDLGLFSADDGERIRRDTARFADEALTTRRSRMERWAEWRPPDAWMIPDLDPRWNLTSNDG